MPADPNAIHQAWMVIAPSDAERRNFLASDQLLVHYTNASTSILASNEFRLRNARKMADETEIKIGRECVDQFLADNRLEIETFLNCIYPKLSGELFACWNNEKLAQIDQTFIGCFTVQDADDNQGSTFHWEHYGKVALCLDPTFLRDEPSQLCLYLVKVKYGKDAIMKGLDSLLLALKTQRDLLQAIDRNVLLSFLRHRLFFESVANKGDDYSCEQEWRIVHAPFLFASAHVLPDPNTIPDQSDQFYALPLKDPLGTTSSGLATKDLVRKVLIHPACNGSVADLRHNIISQLKYHGANDAATRVRLLNTCD